MEIEDVINSRDGFSELNREYSTSLYNTLVKYEKNANRKTKKPSKEEVKSDIRSQLSFLIWGSIVTFIGYHFANAAFFIGDSSTNHFKAAFVYIMEGKCNPSLPNIPSNTYDIRTRLFNLVGLNNIFGNAIVASSTLPVCEIFRHSVGIITGSIMLNANAMASLPGLMLNLASPILLKNLISKTVDTVFNCFQNPENALKIKNEVAEAESKMNVERTSKRIKDERELIDSIQSYLEKNESKSNSKSKSKSKSKSSKSKKSSSKTRSNRIQQHSDSDAVVVKIVNDPIKTDQFHEKLKEHGLLKMYEHSIEELQKQRGGAIGTIMTSLAAINLVMSTLAVSGLAWWNYDIVSQASANHELLSNPIWNDHPMTNFVLTVFGVGSNSVGKGFLSSVSATILDKLSFAGAWQIGDVFGKTASESGFVDWMSKLHAYF